MKCNVPRCNKTPIAPVARKKRIPPPPLDLCADHRPRYEKDYHRHFGPLADGLAKRWLVRRGVAASRVRDVVEALTDLKHLHSWQNTWLQMVDLEMLNSGVGGEQVEWVGGAWVPVKAKPAPSSVRTSGPLLLPEHATEAGQAAIAKRTAEQQALERQLAADATEYARGRRMELEMELKTKRAAKQKAKGSA